MNRDRRLASARRNRTLMQEAGMGRESQSSFLSFEKGNSAIMIEFHQFDVSPADEIARLHNLGLQLLTYVRLNRGAIVNYGKRYRAGLGGLWRQPVPKLVTAFCRCPIDDNLCSSPDILGVRIKLARGDSADLRSLLATRLVACKLHIIAMTRVPTWPVARSLAQEFT
ncbi:hypothetical protein [Mesorhizobium neociceri]|uniref:Uncharacterized protein n=1 Tax=Mesorhizobium neociceri TaxID=1307853 RepID=A0A838B6U7_9HYPH|nr:hypothetical protein [Mesorhizobium neociceri]MBA1142346.1 hypothetical protein [Mesorhizobium neociceri]